VHGYAGRVGLRVITSEARSKVRRMREKTEIPPELQNPKLLLGLDEGKVFTSTTEMLNELAKMSGLSKYKHEEKTLGDLYSTRRLLTIEGSKRADYVLKHFADIRSIKWALLGAWAFSRKFSMMPQARLHREYAASRKLREHGIRTPEVVGVAINEKVLVTEYIDGTPLSREVEQNLQDKSTETEDIFSYGSTLAQIHSIGFSLGDSKASNVIIKGGEVFITDLEQAEEGGDAAWDVAEFLYYTAKLSTREDGMRRVAEAFLRGYTQRDGREVVSKATNPKYLAPFRPFVTRQMTKAISELLTNYSK
jgi:Kae1-associated kinase Bud32